VLLDNYVALKKGLKRIHESRGKEAIFRSKVQWVELGEKPTKYFFKLEKANYEKKVVREVKLQYEEVISNPVHVNKKSKTFTGPCMLRGRLHEPGWPG